MTKRIIFCLFTFFVFLMPLSSSAEVDINPAILQELTARHPVFTVESLIELAGGEDELVSQLLLLRLRDKPAQAAINAEKILLGLSFRKDVQEALLEDVSTEDRFGLGSVVLSRIDDIKDEEFKMNLAKKALTASTKFEMRQSGRYRLLLKESSNTKLRALVE